MGDIFKRIKGKRENKNVLVFDRCDEWLNHLKEGANLKIGFQPGNLSNIYVYDKKADVIHRICPTPQDDSVVNFSILRNNLLVNEDLFPLEYKVYLILDPKELTEEAMEKYGRRLKKILLFEPNENIIEQLGFQKFELDSI